MKTECFSSQGALLPCQLSGHPEEIKTWEGKHGCREEWAAPLPERGGMGTK